MYVLIYINIKRPLVGIISLHKSLCQHEYKTIGACTVLRFSSTPNLYLRLTEYDL